MTVNERVGFIGLGDMGRHLARNMQRAAPSFAVYDIRHEAMAPFEDSGAYLASDVPDLVRHSDVVAFCVLDDAQVRDLVLGAGGLIGSLRRGQLVLMHSTVAPALALGLFESLAAQGIGFLDAPVSGGMTAREQGAVTVFAGGRPADFERAKPLLEAVGGTVGFLGPPGSGAAGKICNNLMHFCNALGLFEGLRLAAAYGIDEPAMIRLGAASTARSWALTELASIDQILLEHTLADDDEALFDFFAKDLEIAVAEARHAALPLPFADRAAELVRDSFKKRRDSVRQIRTR